MFCFHRLTLHCAWGECRCHRQLAKSNVIWNKFQIQSIKNKAMITVICNGISYDYALLALECTSQSWPLGNFLWNIHEQSLTIVAVISYIHYFPFVLLFLFTIPTQWNKNRANKYLAQKNGTTAVTKAQVPHRKKKVEQKKKSRVD